MAIEQPKPITDDDINPDNNSENDSENDRENDSDNDTENGSDRENDSDRENEPVDRPVNNLRPVIITPLQVLKDLKISITRDISYIINNDTSVHVNLAYTCEKVEQLFQDMARQIVFLKENYLYQVNQVNRIIHNDPADYRL